MKAVYKYPITFEDHLTLMLPRGAQILAFACQHDRPMIWALINPLAPLTPRHFRFAGTGHEIHDFNLKHIGTAQMSEGSLVWHLFEILPEAACTT